MVHEWHDWRLGRWQADPPTHSASRPAVAQGSDGTSCARAAPLTRQPIRFGPWAASNLAGWAGPLGASSSLHSADRAQTGTARSIRRCASSTKSDADASDAGPLDQGQRLRALNTALLLTLLCVYARCTTHTRCTGGMGIHVGDYRRGQVGPAEHSPSHACTVSAVKQLAAHRYDAAFSADSRSG